jgi:hypothetical protein
VGTIYPTCFTTTNCAFCVYGFVWFSLQTASIFLGNINQLSIVMLKCCVFFEVRTEFLNIIQTRASKCLYLFEATPYHNVLTFTLFLPEGRAGVAWERSNKMMLFLPPRKIKYLSFHPFISSLNLLFIYPYHLSLSLRLQTVDVSNSLFCFYGFM